MEIDIEADQEIAQAAGVSGTPTVQMFKVGRGGAGERGEERRAAACEAAPRLGDLAAHPARAPPLPLPQSKARVANLPGVKMKRDYKAVIEQHLEAPVPVAAK